MSEVACSDWLILSQT